jgi:hypothetical protein
MIMMALDDRSFSLIWQNVRYCMFIRVFLNYSIQKRLNLFKYLTLAPTICTFKNKFECKLFFYNLVATYCDMVRLKVIMECLRFDTRVHAVRIVVCRVILLTETACRLLPNIGYENVAFLFSSFGFLALKDF